MRAGAFAEKRVIDLVNRRFVPFFFNRGGPGEGHDEAASAFATGKTQNPWAYLAVFDPDTGALLGESALYADKDETFAFLMALLEKHPEAASFTAEEEAVLARATPAADPAARLAAGILLEEVGRTKDAMPHLEAALGSGRGATAFDAAQALARIARAGRDWKAHARWCDELAARVPPGREAEAEAAAGCERGFRLIADGRWDEARTLLQPLARAHGDSVHAAQLHFSAGVACWMGGDRAWAKFHFGWVVEHRPEDRLHRRAYVAAAAEAMPYANPELGGYEAPVGNIGTEHIAMGVRRALRVYERLRPCFERGELRGPEGDAAAEPGAPPTGAAALVAQLADGNEHRVANNRIVDQLVALGEQSVDPLLKAALDPTSDGRGYAAWALAKVLVATGNRPEAALAALQDCTRSDDPYVAALSRSGLKILREADAKAASR